MKNRMISIIILTLTCLAAVAAFIAQKKDGEQNDRIEDLGKINLDLGGKVNELTSLNNRIGVNTEKIVSRNESLSQENIELTNDVKTLISEVDRIVKALDQRTDQEFAVSGKFDFKANFNPNGSAPTADLGSNIFELPAGGNISNLIKERFISTASFSDCIIQIKDNKIFLSAKIYDISRHLIAEVDKNNWRINKNMISKFNFDHQGLEIFDNYGNIALSVDVSVNNIFKIQGIFTAPNSLECSIITSSGVLSGGGFTSQQTTDFLKEHPFTQLFRYTGDRWRGVRNNPNTSLN